MLKQIKHDKLFGYALLILGLILLIFSIFEMTTVYYGSSPPPQLFDLQDISVPLGQTGSDISLIQGAQISQLANLFAWLILMGFILFAGGKIASLGVNMIKDIQVQIKDSSASSPETTSITS